MIKIDLKVGDTILTGKWKNKKVVVKSIGTDEFGNPTVNGKSILKIRIPKLYMKEQKMSKNIKLKSLLKEAFPSSQKQTDAIKKLDKANPELYSKMQDWIADGGRLDIVLDYASDQFKNFDDFLKLKPTINTVYKALSGRNN